MDTQPKIPTLKDSQKPQVKVRGLEAGATLFDRLKQFKKKDLAFILAGLGTLFMAPLAEHFMMSPEGGDATLNQGFGKGGAGSGNGIFGGNGPASYDSANGLAPGGAIGGGSDVITPLNVRDPSALIMGPNATPQPPTSSVAPPTAPPTAPAKSDSDLRDALAASAARGVGGAAKAAKALLPVPKVALGGSGLRGLGVSNGSSSASAGLAPISSNGLATNKAAGSNSLGNVKAMPGYKGVAARGPGQGSGGLEALKKAAGDAGEGMNRGAASTALDQTAAQGIPNGGSSFGGNGAGGTGGTDKGFGGNQGKDSRSTGESLEFLKQKAMQDAKIALWAKEQEAGDGKLEMLKIRNSIAEAIGSKVGDAVGSKVGCYLTKGFEACSKADKILACQSSGGSYPMSDVTDSEKDCFGKDASAYLLKGDKLYVCSGYKPGDKEVATGCFPVDGAAAGKSSTPQGGVTDTFGNQQMVGSLKKNCDSAEGIIHPKADEKSKTTAGVKQPVSDYFLSYQSAVTDVANAHNALVGGDESVCGTGSNAKAARVDAANSVDGQIASILAKVKGTVTPKLRNSVLAGSAEDAGKHLGDASSQYQSALQDFGKAKAAFDAASQALDKAKGSVNGVKNPTDKDVKGMAGTQDMISGLTQSTKNLDATRDNLKNALASLGGLLTGDKPTDGVATGGPGLGTSPEESLKAVVQGGVKGNGGGNNADQDKGTVDAITKANFGMAKRLKEYQTKAGQDPNMKEVLEQVNALSYDVSTKVTDQGSGAANVSVEQVNRAIAVFKQGSGSDYAKVDEKLAKPDKTKVPADAEMTAARTNVEDARKTQVDNLAAFDKAFDGVKGYLESSKGPGGVAPTTGAPTTTTPTTDAAKK